MVAALLDTETAVDGVTHGAIRSDLKAIAVVSRISSGTLKAEEFALTAGWAHAGKSGITMPERGRLNERAAQPEELSEGLGGPSTLDVPE